MRKLSALLLALLLTVPAYAGRDFDGTDDEISLGSDASIDEFATRTICAWVRSDSTGVGQVIATKGTAVNEFMSNASTDLPRYSSDWTGDGNWIATTDVVDGATFFHRCVVYSNSATTNDPTFYVNGATDALTTDTNPTGSRTSDAANELQLGESNNDAGDFNGNVGWFIFTNTDLGAAGVNRARWWGRAGGGLVVYHPFVTTKLANEGSGTADGTATGTTVISIPKVQRPGTVSLTGVGL